MVKRYGRLGSWEPPTPGASKQITSMAGSSASTNGCQASSRMPMPLHSRSGGPVPVPGRIATRSGVPPDLRDLFAHGVIPDRHVHSSSGTPWLPPP